MGWRRLGGRTFDDRKLPKPLLLSFVRGGHGGLGLSVSDTRHPPTYPLLHLPVTFLVRKGTLLGGLEVSVKFLRGWVGILPSPR